MKDSTVKIIIAGIIVLVFFFTISSKNDHNDTPRLISVVGQAEVKVVPDQIVFCVGAGTWHKVLNTAKAENDRIVKKVKQVAERFNIQSKHIMTDYLDVVPDYDDHYRQGEKIIEGYHVYKRISITLTEIERFEELFCELLKTGINYVYHIQYRTSSLSQYREQARSLAIRAAKTKATRMAEELGQRIGLPHAVSEWQPERNWLHRDSYLLTNSAVNVNSQSTVDMATMALGQITVKETVTVSFELE
jgi:uncharacterized protein YggE